MQKFYESGSIKKNMFSLHLSGDRPKLVIGGYDEKVIEEAGTKRSGPEDQSKDKTDDGIFWMFLNSDIYW